MPMNSKSQSLCTLKTTLHMHVILYAKTAGIYIMLNVYSHNSRLASYNDLATSAFFAWVFHYPNALVPAESQKCSFGGT